MENENISLEQFIEKHSIKFSQEVSYNRPDLPNGGIDEWPRGSSHFKVRIGRGRRSFGLYFSQGSGIRDVPGAATVLDCLASDAASYENTKDFEDWASEFGYDTDSRKAERTYRMVKRQAEQLKRTIGEDAYNELLWNTERL